MSKLGPLKCYVCNHMPGIQSSTYDTTNQVYTYKLVCHGEKEFIRFKESQLPITVFVSPNLPKKKDPMELDSFSRVF